MRVEAMAPARVNTVGELPSTRSLSGISDLPASISASPANSDNPNFADVLTQALGRVNEAVQTADQQARRVASGEADNLHEPLLAMAEADLALQVTMRVTQKAIAAYQEVSRMQI